MKKFFKTITLVVAMALGVSLSACNLAEKTENRRAEYIADGQEIVASLEQANYSAANWAIIENYLVEYEDAIGSVAAKSKMEAALKELKLNINTVITIDEEVDQYLEAVDGRINEALVTILAKLEPYMGISNITYNKSENHAVFTISDETALIRYFADTGICDLFQNMFADVTSATITANGKTDTLTNAMLTGPSLKHEVGEHFIRLYVEDYAYAPLSHLVAGGVATAEVTFDFNLADGTAVTESCTFSCSFVAAN